MQKEKKQSMGALWKRSGQYGEYLSGQIEIAGVKHNFKAYVNNYKKEEKQPDYRLFLDAPKELKTKIAPSNQWMTDEDVPF
jgi:uncharacterized protein (DUF736 family)